MKTNIDNYGHYIKEDYRYTSNDGKIRIGTVENKILYIDFSCNDNRESLKAYKSLTIDWLTVYVEDESKISFEASRNETKEDRIAVIEGIDKNDINFVLVVRNKHKTT